MNTSSPTIGPPLTLVGDISSVSSAYNTRIGAWHDRAGSEFIVWAPLREKVELLLHGGDGSGGSGLGAEEPSIHALEKDAGGYWRVTVAAPPGTRYQYRLDGEGALPDPASFHQPAGVHGPSAVTDPGAFRWKDEQWEGIPLSNMVIYELHVGSFSSSHDFDGVIRKLDHFLDLGINTLELMPLGQFPGERNWGYDGVFPFAIQNSYGGIGGFQRLVDAAHAKGIAILVDVVYNHFGPEGNYVGEYGPYFTDKYQTPWGKAVNMDDAWSDGVRNYFWQNARMWLEDYHVDGLRLDAVHAIKDFSAVHFMRQLKEQVNEIERKTGRKKELIAELDLNDPRYIDPPERGGYGLDGQWIDEFHHSLHALLTGETNGYYEDFGDIQHLRRAFRDTYVYSGDYSPHRKRIFGTHVDNNPFSQFVVFAQNHDHIGNRAQGDRLTASLSLAQLQLAAATVLLSPYVPLLFMGEEYGERQPFPFFVSFTDTELVEAVRKGRKAEFPGFSAGQDLPDPQAAATFEQAGLSWPLEDDVATGSDDAGSDEDSVLEDDPASARDGAGAEETSESVHRRLYAYYKALIAFRKMRPAMQGRTRDTMVVHSVEAQVVCFERKIVNDRLLIVLHFGGETASLANPVDGTLRRLFDGGSAPEKWSATGSEVPPGGAIELAPFAVLIFEISK